MVVMENVKQSPNKWLVFSLVAVGIFMSTLDGSIVNIALPEIMSDLATSLSTIQWVVMVYLLTVSSLLLSFGKLSDIRGRRWVYSRGLVVFAAGSLLCGIAQNAHFLITARGFQGVGAAMIMACTPALIADAFPIKERGRALGMIGAVVSSGLTVGPALGGVMVHYLPWQFIFYINIPIGLTAAFFVSRTLKNSKADIQRNEAFDWIGSILLTLAMGTFLFAFTHARDWGYSSLPIIALLIVSVVSIGGIIYVEPRVQHPVIEPSLIKIRLFVFPMLSAVVLFLGLFTVVFMMPFYLMHPCGFSSNKAGLIMVTPFVFLFLLSPLSGAISDRIGSRLLCTLGLGILSFSLYSFTWIEPSSDPLDTAWRLALTGIGTAIFIAPNSSVTMSAVPRKHMGVAAGTVATSRNTGMVLGVALAGTLFNSAFTTLSGGLELKEYRPELQTVFMDAFHFAMTAGASFTCFGMIISFMRGPDKALFQRQKTGDDAQNADTSETIPVLDTNPPTTYINNNGNYRTFRIKAVLFDFDGTLTLPEALDFKLIKEKIGCPSDKPVLEFLEEIKSTDAYEPAFRQLEAFELDAAEKSVPDPDVPVVISYLQSKGVKIGILTRNNRKSVLRALENFEIYTENDFDLIISRDDPLNPKPDADGVLLAALRWNIDVKEILMVGDYIFDMQAGRKAGALTAFLDRGSITEGVSIDSDFSVTELKQIKDIVRRGIPLPAGKFPNDLLKGSLDELTFDDPSVVINPGVGEDIAAVDVDNEEILILKSDPITFATDAIAHYAVLVNANDIATSGAIPRWFLTTLLFPVGITGSHIQNIIHELKTVCQEWGITLCGGHTEISDAVTRPVINGMLAGTVKKSALIHKRNMKPGDKVLLTKAVSVEGTSIIAREFSKRLIHLGMTEKEIEKCKKFLSWISILDEARLAGRFPGVTAMHDVTEGGLATALHELSVAGAHVISVDIDHIPIFPLTERICRLLEIDPLGLIGSGSLLITCDKNRYRELMDEISKAGIHIACIGDVGESGEGIKAHKKGRPAEWPVFEVDEITRLF